MPWEDKAQAYTTGFKSTLEPLSIHLNIKAAMQEATRFSAALHIQAHYRGNKDRASIPKDFGGRYSTYVSGLPTA